VLSRLTDVGCRSIPGRLRRGLAERNRRQPRREAYKQQRRFREEDNKFILPQVHFSLLRRRSLFWRKAFNSQADSEPMAAVPFTSHSGLETTPSFSPDGSRIAFAWDNGTGNRTGKAGYDLYVKAIGSETLLRLTNHPSDWISSVWSPDGTQIAFHRLEGDDNGIYVVAALGGPERKLIATHTPREAPLSWSPDGKWIAYSDTENSQPGDRAFLLHVATLESHEFPHEPSCQHEGFLTFSHSGRELALLCVHNTASSEFMVSDLEGKSRRSLTTMVSNNVNGCNYFFRGMAWERGCIVPNTANRPNVSGTPKNRHTVSQWFDTSVFSAPAPGTWGDEPPNAVRGPGRDNWNISLFKNFLFNKDRGTNLQFRAEFFNIWNHPQWIGDGFNGGISTNYGASNFGAVTSAHDPRTIQLALKFSF